MNNEKLFSITKKDLNITFFSGTGPGGQHKNRHKNCIRINHKDSGVLVTGQSHKERRSNIKEALENLVKHPKFKIWISSKVKEIMDGKTLEEKIEEMIIPENIIIEYKENDKWIKENKDE